MTVAGVKGFGERLGRYAARASELTRGEPDAETRVVIVHYGGDHRAEGARAYAEAVRRRFPSAAVLIVHAGTPVSGAEVEAWREALGGAASPPAFGLTVGWTELADEDQDRVLAFIASGAEG
ncbi:MAG: hypothetical protein K8I02_06355, partial [Candidatus Methylomirabilis sp.]|nr:hypothetical protein [Deltaproteobacteria bacterium]